jgi:hypothetical protein
VTPLGKPLRIWIGIVIVCAIAPAQSTVLSELEEDVPRNPPGVYGPLVAADFDDDGDPDLLRTDGVLFNDGNARFSGAGNSPGGIFACAYSPAVADFDGDGDIDVAAGVCGTTTMLALNNGNGTFIPAPVALPLVGGVNNNMFGLRVGDFDGDGKPDVVGATAFSKLFVWRNVTGTTFSLVTFLPTGANQGLLGIGDVDGDGDDDIVFVETTPAPISAVSRIASLVGNSFIVGAPLHPAMSYVNGGVGDWNADGYADFLRSAATQPITSVTDVMSFGGPGGLGLS